MKGEIGYITPRSHDWRLSGVADQRIAEAMEKVSRNVIFPFGTNDRRWPKDQSHTVSPPIVVATMTDALRPLASDRVLEIGVGSGYQTAVLAELTEAVYTVEVDSETTENVRKRLDSLGYHNVRLRYADGYDGWIEEAPFDAILVTAPAEDVPATLLDQLRDGGRMVLPIGTPAGPHELILIKKQGKTLTTRSLLPVQFVSIS